MTRRKLHRPLLDKSDRRSRKRRNQKRGAVWSSNGGPRGVEVVLFGFFFVFSPAPPPRTIRPLQSSKKVYRRVLSLREIGRALRGAVRRGACSRLERAIGIKRIAIRQDFRHHDRI